MRWILKYLVFGSVVTAGTLAIMQGYELRLVAMGTTVVACLAHILAEDPKK